MFTLHLGDCVEVLRSLPDASVDAVVTDPPYDLTSVSRGGSPRQFVDNPYGRARVGIDRGGFMGKTWDGTGIAFSVELWVEVSRVLKPGGHLLAFGGTRTYHRMVCAIEDAGFEIRDSIHWAYGSGFPKSMNVGKVTEKEVERRYGSARCNCVDTNDGRAGGDSVGWTSGSDARTTRGQGEVPQTEDGSASLEVDTGAGDCDVSGVWHSGGEEAAGSPSVTCAVLLPTVRGCGTEAEGFGDAALRPGVESREGEGDGEGRRSMPSLFCTGDAGPPSGPVSVRWDERSAQLGQSVRVVSPPGGGADYGSAGVDPGHRRPRELGLDDLAGRQRAMARVCSWCGLPDRQELDHLHSLGTALKPAHEPIVVARKPLMGTVAANVQLHGTGALNIDATRTHTPGSKGAEYTVVRRKPGATQNATGGNYRPEEGGVEYQGRTKDGRWPANLLISHSAACVPVGIRKVKGITGTSAGRMAGKASGVYGNYAGDDERAGEPTGYVDADGSESVQAYECVPGCPVAELDRQSGDRKSGARVTGNERSHTGESGIYGTFERVAYSPHNDVGGASRFFPVFPGEAPFLYCAKASGSERNKGVVNNHPTVKPVALMRWLVRLVAPPGALVLDPFVGSGSTGVAATEEGCEFVGIDSNPEYLEIARARISGAQFAPSLF